MPLIRKEPPGGPPAAEAAAKAAGDLRHGPRDARWSAARGCGDVRLLAEALGTEDDAGVREAIFTSLVRIGGEAAVEAVLPHLRSDDAGVRTGALDALRAMAPATAAHLPGLLHDADPDVRLLICEVARNLPGPLASHLLCAVIETEREANVCAAAVEVLAEVGGPDALEPLRACAARFGDEPFLVFAIRAALERIGAPGTRPRG